MEGAIGFESTRDVGSMFWLEAPQVRAGGGSSGFVGPAARAAGRAEIETLALRREIAACASPLPTMALAHREVARRLVP